MSDTFDTKIAAAESLLSEVNTLLEKCGGDCPQDKSKEILAKLDQGAESISHALQGIQGAESGESKKTGDEGDDRQAPDESVVPEGEQKEQKDEGGDDNDLAKLLDLLNKIMNPIEGGGSKKEIYNIQQIVEGGGGKYEKS